MFVFEGHNIVCEFTRNIIYPQDNIVSPWRTQNEVTPYGVNEVAFGKQCCASHKRCGLTPNDVALRANTLAPPPLLCYNKPKAVNYMKKFATVLICLGICVFFVGCEDGKECFVFNDLGIEVKMKIDETISVSYENNTMLISNNKNNEDIGVISVVKEKGKSINEIYDTYITGRGERTKTVLSDELIFVEIINKVDSVALGERVDKMYCFIFYDENTGAVLYGRFFENSERDYVIILARTIEVEKI